MNKNAPFIREIIDRSQKFGGTKIKGQNSDEIKANVNKILKQQLNTVKHYNVRAQAY